MTAATTTPVEMKTEHSQPAKLQHNRRSAEAQALGERKNNESKGHGA